jgi:hypothetical protein
VIPVRTQHVAQKLRSQINSTRPKQNTNDITLMTLTEPNLT